VIGHTFPDQYTRWQGDVRGSASHQRIISYQFAGLKLLVRSEADGYLKTELGVEEEHESATSSPRGDVHDTAKTAPPAMLAIDNVRVRSGGRLIPQHAIFELKTRGAHKKDEDQMVDHLPRMWTAQTPFFILAFHEWGSFKPEDITVQDVRGKVSSWQDENQDLLRRFSALLDKLVAMARDPAIGKFEVCLQQRGILELRKQGGSVSSPLPSPLIWIWADQGDSDSDSSSRKAFVGAEDSDADFAAHSDADDDDFTENYTACSTACGYCGHCSYRLR
jgi:hypothetical protein